jgi:gamma-glutamyltranspeptidase/glutathione hydrolase
MFKIITNCKYFIIISCIISWSSFAGNVTPNAPAIASAHPLATQAGYDILKQGGNAFDAAVAVSSVLSVVEPYSSGLGGGAFFLLHRESDQFQIFVDAREKAPGKADADMYLDEFKNVIPRVSLDGTLAAGIPGLAAGLTHVSEKYGVLPLDQVLAPAIALAENGFPVYERFITALKVAIAIDVMSPKFIENFTLEGEIPEVGTLIKQPELANTLKVIASQGHDGFYNSELTETIVTESNESGSIWTINDFKNYEIVEREPLQVKFSDYQLTLAPPPSSGGTTIATILNILSEYNYRDMNTDEFVHLITEAMRRAYKDRSEFLGDPDFVAVPILKLISKNNAIKHSSSINLDRATPSKQIGKSFEANPKEKGTETTHFSILDQDGNRVSTTQTINTWFGSGYMLPSAGFILNNEMDDFSAKAFAPNRYGLVHGEANSIAPNKRMVSSMSPTFIESKDDLAILGTPGGAKIITMVLLSLISWTEGADADAMTSGRRFHHQYLPDEIHHEKDAFGEDVIDSLVSKGHSLKEIGDYGNMQVVTYKKSDGSVKASSDPRALIENSEIDFY